MPRTELLNFYGSVLKQNMSVSSNPNLSKNAQMMTIQISGIVLTGKFKDKELQLQISRDLNFDISEKYHGALIYIKPELSFVVSTSSDSFSNITTLIASKALMEVYLCFEKPKYGKARVVSWSVNTATDEYL